MLLDAGFGGRGLGVVYRDGAAVHDDAVPGDDGRLDPRFVGGLRLGFEVEKGQEQVAFAGAGHFGLRSVTCEAATEQRMPTYFTFSGILASVRSQGRTIQNRYVEDVWLISKSTRARTSRSV